MKRFFDIIISVMGLIILSPLLLGIAWYIHLEDGGPVFYRGKRVGLHGKPFRIFKFRTMVVNAETIGGPSTPDDDPRISWSSYGSTLMSAPTLNVLGDMSLVGASSNALYRYVHYRRKGHPERASGNHRLGFHLEP
jgi:lipopolysaccharide/colanic/teichoic acid biosynthesis glycosyltransferase